MPAAYDNFDYPSYWETREYEHKSEIVALEAYLSKIPEIKKIIEIGAGFGRFTPFYSFRAKKVILTDPSAKLLKIARKALKEKNVKFIQSSAENLQGRLKGSTADLVVLVRVLHHIKKPEEAIKEANRLLKNKGFFILEYPNKAHFKARAREFLKGNFTYLIDVSEKDVRSKSAKRRKTLPFYNFHPEKIENLLKKYDFKIVEKRSVSNIRSTFIKRHIPTSFLLWIESFLQKILSYLNFGPSIFILAQKVKK